MKVMVEIEKSIEGKKKALLERLDALRQAVNDGDIERLVVFYEGNNIRYTSAPNLYNYILELLTHYITKRIEQSGKDFICVEQRSLLGNIIYVYYKLEGDKLLRNGYDMISMHQLYETYRILKKDGSKKA